MSDWLGIGHTIDDLRALLATAPPPPTGSTVSLAEALEDVERFIARFVIFPRPEARLAVVLFVAHPYALDAADVAVYIAVSSPEKASGKTTLLEVISLLVPGKPNITITPTASTVFRTLEADPDTVLILDELDSIYGDRSDKFEEIRGIINAGHRRGATVPRSVPKGGGWEVVRFPVFGPKALAGIGRLPDTIVSRAVPVRMLKRKRAEAIERFRYRFALREAEPIAERLAAALSATPPATEAKLPDELGDRAADVWEPLLAIADAAGAEWPGGPVAPP